MITAASIKVHGDFMEYGHITRPQYLFARAYMRALKGLYIHGAVFVAVMLGLVVLNAAGTGPWWVQWPLIGWGAGILGHAYAVFSTRSGIMHRWERRVMTRTLAKMRAANPTRAAPSV